MTAQKPDRDDPGPVGASTARMTQAQVAFMLVAAVRMPTVAIHAERIQSSHFDARSEAHLILFWRAASAAAKRHGGVLPADAAAAREIVGVRCTEEIAADPSESFYTPQVQHRVLGQGGLVDEAFTMPVGPAVESEAVDLMIRFLTERAAFEPIRRAILGLGPNDVPADLNSMAAALVKHSTELAGLRADPTFDAIVDSDDFRPPGADTFTTGEAWLDQIMDGGQAGHEVYALLGATGAGKSSLGVQLAYNSVKAQVSAITDIGSDMAGHWYYFTYELTLDQVRERVYAYGAKISRSTFNGKDKLGKRLSYSTAADPSTLREYEREIIVNSPKNPIRGELERMRALRLESNGLNKYFHIVDYSGSVAGQGLGGVDEMAGYLAGQRARGCRIGGVVVDYAGLSVSRYVADRRLRPEAEYPILNTYIDSVRTKVAIPFDCPCWVMHQLHGDFTKGESGAKVHHSSAKGSRNFADNADFAFGLPRYNDKTRLLTMSMTKSRRAPGTEDAVILRYDGRFSMFTPPSEEYVVDAFTHQIVPRGFADRIAPPTAGPRQRPFVDPRAGT